MEHTEELKFDSPRKDIEWVTFTLSRHPRLSHLQVHFVNGGVFEWSCPSIPMSCFEAFHSWSARFADPKPKRRKEVAFAPKYPLYQVAVLEHSHHLSLYCTARHRLSPRHVSCQKNRFLEKQKACREKKSGDARKSSIPTSARKSSVPTQLAHCMCASGLYTKQLKKNAVTIEDDCQSKWSLYCTTLCFTLCPSLV